MSGKPVSQSLVFLAFAGITAVLLSTLVLSDPAAAADIEAGTRVTVRDRVALTDDGTVAGMAEPGSEMRVVEVDGEWARVEWTRDTKAITGWVQLRHIEPLRGSSPVTVDRLLAGLERLFNEDEFVAIAFSADAHPGAIRTEAAGYAFEDWFKTGRPKEGWSLAVTLDAGAEGLMSFLTRQAARLWQCQESKGHTGPTGTARGKRVTLVFHLPKAHELRIDATRALQLSPAAQQYLKIADISEYPAMRRVLLVAEPHADVDAQFVLFKGLEYLLGDNSALREDGAAVFLSEGTATGQGVSVRWLVDAASDPSDALVRGVLDTHLIPGHVAYAWKTGGTVPILGLEDEVLYRLCARMTCAQAGTASGTAGPPATAPEVWRAKLYYQTVVARNQSIVGSLVEQLDRHACPFVFLGAGHLESWPQPATLSPADWEAARSALDDAEFRLLRTADRRGVREMLQERGIGYYLLAPRTCPIRGRQLDELARQQYLTLMQAQVSGDLTDYVRGLKRSEEREVARRPVAAVPSAHLRTRRRTSWTSLSKPWRKKRQKPLWILRERS